MVKGMRVGWWWGDDEAKVTVKWGVSLNYSKRKQCQTPRKTACITHRLHEVWQSPWAWRWGSTIGEVESPRSEWKCTAGCDPRHPHSLCGSPWRTALALQSVRSPLPLSLVRHRTDWTWSQTLHFLCLLEEERIVGMVLHIDFTMNIRITIQGRPALTCGQTMYYSIA